MILDLPPITHLSNVLTPTKTEFLKYEDFLRILKEQRDNIESVTTVPPDLVKGTWGGVRVEYKIHTLR